MDDQIRGAIGRLRSLRDMYDGTAKEVFGHAPGNLYNMDFFYLGALNRSYCLLRGFCDLLESENFMSAVPLVRLQLDCCLRAAAPGLVEDPSLFASAVLGGTSVRDLKDKDGKPLTDACLLDLLVQDYPWVRDVYRESSGFIHLSDKHIFNAMRIESERDHTVLFKVSDRDQFVPGWAYTEAIDVLAKLSAIFLAHIRAYGEARCRWNSTSDAGPAEEPRPGPPG